MTDNTEDTFAESLAQDTELTEADKLALLKSQADLLGLQYHPNIGYDTLLKKIKAKRSELETGEKPAAEPQVVTNTGENSRLTRMRQIREANSLIRCRITCMNPHKKDWPGEIFTVSNGVVGTVRKFIPFNTAGGDGPADGVVDAYFVPRLILNQIQNKKYPSYYTVTDNYGRKHRRSKLVREFSIEILPLPTQKELDELARLQAMANGGSSL